MTEDHAVSEASQPMDALSLVLPMAMTIENAEAVVLEFRKILEDGTSALTLDASQIATLTTPGIQVLVALKKTLASRGGTLVIDGKNEAFTRAFAEVGLQA